MKYTPEPWRMIQSCIGTYNIVKDNGYTLTRIGEAQTREDADLIASAPEMYEALNWLVHLCHDVGKKGGRPEGGEWETAIVEAEKVLQKARGKQ